MDENIRKILEAGCQAPSGSNSQPWKFRVRDNNIDILAFPEKDHLILNYRNRGTWIAHGALIENILIAAPAFGYKASFKIFPYDSNSRVIASISLEKFQIEKNPLYSGIYNRATNRKPYQDKSLTSAQKEIIINSTRDISGVEVRMVESKEKLKLLGKAIAVNEIVMFENQFLHKLMFQEIVWNRKEEEQHGGGLYVKTMELKPPQVLALKIFRYWPIARFLNKIGAAKSIAKDNAKGYSSAALMGIVVVEDQDESFIDAGRIIERIWLIATELNLSFHLITGVMFLNMRIKAGQDREFSAEQIKLVRDAYKTVSGVYDVKRGVIAGLFRIGYSDPPSATSIKLPPVVL